MNNDRVLENNVDDNSNPNLVILFNILSILGTIILILPAK